MRVAAGFVSIAILLAGLVPGTAQAGPALLIDAGNGKILYAEDQDDLWHPASLTKIMTAYVTFAALKAGTLKLDSRISYSEAASLQAPSKVGLPVGAEMTVDDALKALIVKSANDVAVMLAEAIAGGEAQFAETMNATAKRLGMTRTHFANPNGLPHPQQVTTARDLARLSQAVLRDFPEHAHYWTMPDMRLGKRRLVSHNGLLRSFEGADGLKTGFICDSGYNIVATATREGRRLLAVVLGEVSGQERNLRAATLLEHGYQSYGWKQIFNTATIDTMPLAAASADPTSVRADVRNYDCNGKRRARPDAVAKARAKAKAARVAKSKGGQAIEAGAAAGGTSTGAVTTGAVKAGAVKAGAPRKGAAQAKPVHKAKPPTKSAARATDAGAAAGPAPVPARKPVAAQ